MDTPHYALEHTARLVHISLPTPREVLSCAVLGGGLTRASHLLNLRVEHTPDAPSAPFVPPEHTLADVCRAHGWAGTTVGMMTAASMNSLRMVTLREGDVDVAALVTSGLSNARRAGDRADWRAFADAPCAPGTINIIILTNARLSPACMAEALCVVSEAKAAALQELDVRSRVSGGVATGTGTDATAVVCGPGPVDVRYCGKHVLFGEMLARATAQALSQSLEWYREHSQCAATV
ncbi:adenosylcobinamide amidohydrolase [Desulfobaculum xiamenense]|uniref:Adenosylcobinamide amidohydrolase n=1 Tax=Desulfobaculum xiamenense TaxID=995050 RepID=A0A846QLP8_9BACT|nr:adenosylcobinamide amidohydrolase [Desulfobaculum xiamenense]NJB68117.1 adenosylcobinamide amidohydrolase [Desulfobaculum xiamenense]